MTTYPIFYATDDHYALPTLVSLYSLIKNSDPTRDYHITILNENLSQENITRLLELARPHCIIDFVSVGARLKKLFSDDGNLLRSDYVAFSMYFRLFIAELFPTLDRALYLDADTLVLADIAKLMDTPLQGKAIGAIPDPAMTLVPQLGHYATQAIGTDSAATYVNSGVLLMDLTALRRMAFAKHFVALLNTYHFHLCAADQDYINAILRDQILYLSKDWDVMGESPEIVSPKLIHYNLFDKPWHYETVPHSAIFWQYARETTAYDGLKAVQAAFTVEEKTADKENMGRILSLSQEVIAGGKNFATAAAQGARIQL